MFLLLEFDLGTGIRELSLVFLVLLESYETETMNYFFCEKENISQWKRKKEKVKEKNRSVDSVDSNAFDWQLKTREKR